MNPYKIGDRVLWKHKHCESPLPPQKATVVRIGMQVYNRNWPLGLKLDDMGDDPWIQPAGLGETEPLND